MWGNKLLLAGIVAFALLIATLVVAIAWTGGLHSIVEL